MSHSTPAETDDDGDPPDPELGDGDRLSERLDELELDDEDAASTDEMRERLGL